MDTERVLPPKVCGNVNGELVVKVDEIFWTQSCPGNVFVHLQWWGEENYNMFWPQDLNRKTETEKERSNMVTYTIKTSPSLFETYVRNCRQLTFFIVKEIDRTIVGSAVIKELFEVLIVKAYSSFSSYFPIYNIHNVRIGDLRISLCLLFNKKLDLSHLKVVGTKKCQRVPLSINTKWCGVPANRNKAIEEVVARSQELRKAMLKSVLKDCPNEHVESLINVPPEAAGDNKLSSTKEKANLLDLVNGKKLTLEDASFARNTLHCIPSPTTSKQPSTAHKLSKKKTTNNIDSFDVSNNLKRDNQKSQSETTLTSQSMMETNRRARHRSSIAIRSGRTDTSFTSRHGNTEHRKKSYEKLPYDVKFLATLDCFRFSVIELRLNLAGAKKVYNSPAIKPTEKQIRSSNAPGTLFSVEVLLPSKTSSAHKSLRKPRVILSKRFHGHEVTFDDAIIQKLPKGDELPWVKVSQLCTGGEIKIYWRHLNQRLPSLFGSLIIPEIKIPCTSPEEVSSTVKLPLSIISNSKTEVGKLFVCVELGRNNKAFGMGLFNAFEHITGKNLLKFNRKMYTMRQSMQQYKF